MKQTLGRWRLTLPVIAALAAITVPAFASDQDAIRAEMMET
jgi:hypothetical protein